MQCDQKQVFELNRGMRKITNSTKITVVEKGSIGQLKERKPSGSVKSSIRQIEQLSQQIDMQMEKNLSNKYKKGREELQINKGEIKKEQSSEEQIGDSTEQQVQRDAKGQIDHLDQTVIAAVRSYFGMNLSEINTQKPVGSHQTNTLTNEQYEEYLKVKQFNRDFILLRDILEKLRRLSLTTQNRQQTVSKEQVKLETQSDVLKMMKQVVNNINQQQENNQNDDIATEQVFFSQNILTAIQKLQQIQYSLQNKLSNLHDDISHKRSVINQLKTNQQMIKDEIEILQSRNNKMLRELNADVSSSEEQEEEDTYQKQEDYSKGQHQLRQQTDPQDQLQVQQNPYQQQYLQLMQHYNLHDPLTGTLHSPFPKNKTEAYLMLNHLDSQISQLELKKTLLSFTS